MRTWTVLAPLMVACGGSTPTPPSAPTVPAAPAAPEVKEGALPSLEAAAPATPAAPPAFDITGMWCGKQVADAVSCKGDEVMLLDLQVDGEKVTGQVCEAFKTDCMQLADSTWKSNTLAIGYKFTGGSVTGSFTPNEADGTLTGELQSTKAKKPIKKTFYRVK